MPPKKSLQLVTLETSHSLKSIPSDALRLLRMTEDGTEEQVGGSIEFE